LKISLCARKKTHILLLIRFHYDNLNFHEEKQHRSSFCIDGRCFCIALGMTHVALQRTVEKHLHVVKPYFRYFVASSSTQALSIENQSQSIHVRTVLSLYSHRFDRSVTLHDLNSRVKHMAVARAREFLNYGVQVDELAMEPSL
jgi:hypothetical protein